MATLRATASAGDGATANTATLTLTVPASAVIGDVAVIICTAANTTSTLTTPTGWTLANQTNSSGVGSSAAGWVFTKTIASGDAGSSVTLTWSTTVRPVAVMQVWQDTTLTGSTIAVAQVGTATASITLPSAASVPAGAGIIAAVAARAPVIAQVTASFPTPYSNPGAAATNLATSPNDIAAAATNVAASAGTYGGETVTLSQASTAVAFVVILPSTAASFSGSLSLSGSGSAAFAQSSMTVSAPASVSGSGGLGLSGAPALSGTLALSGSGSASFAGSPAVPGSLGLSGSTSLSFVQPTGGSIAFTGSGSMALSGSGKLYVFSGPVIYENAPFQPFTAHWSRLVFEIAYGQTVWRAADGSWHQQYAPSPDLLAGALAVYPGGRNYHLTDQQLADLIAGGYGGYITLENMP